MHVLAVFCHPRRESFSGAVLDRFAAGAEAAGHDVEVADLYGEGFEPRMSRRDLRQFDGVAMPPDIIAEQARVERSDALALVFPLWWWSMPAMLKGWLDRVWSAGWAYESRRDPEGSLLEARPCTLLVPAGASSRMMASHDYPDKIVSLWRYGVLDYCGVEPAAIHLLLDANHDPTARERHLETAWLAGRHCMQAPQDLDTLPVAAVDPPWALFNGETGD